MDEIYSSVTPGNAIYSDKQSENYTTATTHVNNSNVGVVNEQMIAINLIPKSHFFLMRSRSYKGLVVTWGRIRDGEFSKGNG